MDLESLFVSRLAWGRAGKCYRTQIHNEPIRSRVYCSDILRYQDPDQFRPQGPLSTSR